MPLNDADTPPPSTKQDNCFNSWRFPEITRELAKAIECTTQQQNVQLYNSEMYNSAIECTTHIV